MMVLGALARAYQVDDALALHRDVPEQGPQQRFARALRWLLSFQCRDGGWAAFDKDVTRRWLEDVPFADHNAILDPTCSDLTGRMLELLGRIGWPSGSVEVQRAITFLRETQESDGSWYGRWGVNYIYGTWQVLRGLRAIGEDMRQNWVIRARDWLASCQNEDGGWGETCASYDDPTLKGKGPSTPSQTCMGPDGAHRCRPIPRRAALFIPSQSLAASNFCSPDKTLMAPGRNRRRRGPGFQESSTCATTCTGTIGRCWHSLLRIAGNESRGNHEDTKDTKD
jgi:squalene cyclase